MLEYVAIVDRGLKHATNDDAALADKNIINEGIFSGKTISNSAVFAVADGIGGMPGSEIASRIALREISECNPDDITKITDAIVEANECILDEAFIRKPRNGYGSTLCVLAIHFDKMFSYNVGNSRLYCMKDGNLKQLTKDRTVAFDMYENGIISYDEIVDNAQSNVLTTYLGSNNFERDWIDIVCHSQELEDDNWFLVCSDGITDYVDDTFLKAVMLSGESLVDMAQSIIDRANELGGNDNQTVMIIKMN